MLVIAVIWFIPIYYLIVTTLKNPQEATANPLGLPIHLEIGNYIKAWTNMQFPRAFANTLFITATAVLSYSQTLDTKVSVICSSDNAPFDISEKNARSSSLLTLFCSRFNSSMRFSKARSCASSAAIFGFT